LGMMRFCFGFEEGIISDFVQILNLLSEI